MKQQLLYQDYKQNNYFEGWYYKLVNKEGSITFSIIVGVSKSNDDSHAFIQIISNYNNQTYYIRYPIASFKAYKPFKLVLDNNVFTKRLIHLHIEDQIIIHGTIQLGTYTNIDTSIYAPTIMGPFSYIPWMECVHAVISLRHLIRGSLTYNDAVLCFDDGVGYIEKDYGTSFPSRYVWMQSNMPNHSDSFFFSYATIPVHKFQFNGLICILEINQVQYRFATYNGAYVSSLKQSNHTLHFTIKRGSSKLICTLSNYQAHPLVAPKKGCMNHIIHESLDGVIDIKFYRKHKLYWQGTLLFVASEIAGFK